MSKPHSFTNLINIFDKFVQWSGGKVIGLDWSASEELLCIQVNLHNIAHIANINNLFLSI
jgi:hypothetical protein